ncbi:Uncharacterized protein FWK35_00015369 [Aphis craccivora]|uniref:Uncharacterized protein n=1 Tax=Aphis craccivora TaxID=307492 RepID=A0A6G0YNU4_APHCR|nr:Uncharacterized protein FWK35_00015369 [Aphis craccivora]
MTYDFQMLIAVIPHFLIHSLIMNLPFLIIINFVINIYYLVDLDTINLVKLMTNIPYLQFRLPYAPDFKHLRLNIENCPDFIKKILLKGNIVTFLTISHVSKSTIDSVQVSISTSMNETCGPPNTKRFFASTTSSGNKNSLISEFCRTYIHADIPISKLENKSLNAFLTKYTGQLIPDETEIDIMIDEVSTGLVKNPISRVSKYASIFNVKIDNLGIGRQEKQ